MRALISRCLLIHYSSRSPLRPFTVSFHSGAGEDAFQRRAEPHNPSSSSSQSSSPRRNYEEENRSIKVTVWWDFENCQVPVGVNVERLATRITAAVRFTGIKGPITITAFGDVAQMSRATQEALTSTGVCLNHVPHSGKNGSNRSFMADLVYWVTQNPPPAHFFLISGDKDFANILHRLRMSNFNVLLATNDVATGVLCSAATVMWHWTELVKGDNVTVKHFNHPPDGFYGSWYGQYKGALDDPFQSSEHSALSSPEESMEPISETKILPEPISETKIRPIPMLVLNGIRNVLHSYPEGMYISELRAELTRRNIPFDKDLYGHKKFSSLLASLPSTVKFLPNPSGEGQPLVSDKRRVESVDISSKPSGQPLVADKRCVESADISSKPSKESVELRSKSIKEAQACKAEKNCSFTRDVKPSPIAPPENADVSFGISKPMHVDTSAGIPKPIPVDVNIAAPTFMPVDMSDAVPALDATASGVETTKPISSDKGSDAEVKEGIFKRIWTALTGRRDGYLASDDKNVILSETVCASSEHATRGDGSKKFQSEEIAEPSKFSYAPSSSNAFGSGEFVSDDKSTAQSGKQNDTPNVGFFNKLANWWKSSYSGMKNQEDHIESVGKQMETDGNEEQVKDVNHVGLHLDTSSLFSSSHFWDTLESFLLTSKGSEIVLKSSTRSRLAYKLQKEGPSSLKDLDESRMSELVEVLISEKRWVDETTSLIFPFILALPAKSKFASISHGSNDLSSLFSARTPQSNSQLKPENHLDNGSVETNPPRNLAELKAWFLVTSNDTDDIKPEQFQKLFEGKFNRKLDCSSYGYPTTQSLLSACLADGNSKQERKKKPPSKEQVLSDCHKLVIDLLKENPTGFNMSYFRPAFLQKYGYTLDCQMVGYPKLASLLQTMPGATVESSFVLPAVMPSSDLDLVSKKPFSGGDGEDWEELGPVSGDTGNMSYSRVSLSDEEVTDSEDEAPRVLGGSKKKTKLGEQDSSLMQILDSWYGGKGCSDGNDQGFFGEAVDKRARSNRNHKNVSDIKVVDHVNKKSRPSKHYSFVKDSYDKEKESDKLIDDMLGSLKKAGDSRLHG